MITMHVRPRQTDRQTNIMAIAWRLVLTNAVRAKNSNTKTNLAKILFAALRLTQQMVLSGVQVKYNRSVSWEAGGGDYPPQQHQSFAPWPGLTGAPCLSIPAYVLACIWADRQRSEDTLTLLSSNEAANRRTKQAGPTTRYGTIRCRN